MSGLNRSDLQTLRAQTIYKNGQQKIKGQDHTNFLIDLIDSCANLITDKEKLNIYEYNNSLAYSSGVGVLYSGGLYQANKDTGLGVFNVADWDLISSGGGSSIFKGEWITLTAYAIGDFVVEAGDMYVCTTGNTDASFTPSNWLKVIEGNITQATSTLAFDDGSTNTDWDGNVFPALQGLVNNQLASRTKVLENSLSSNPSDNIAYVAENGSDTIGEYEVGNPLKPFATANAAISALPSFSIIKLLGGSYTQNINVSKDNLILDISGCGITGTIEYSANNVFINAKNAFVTGNGVNDALQSAGVVPLTGFGLDGGTWDGLSQRGINLTVVDQGCYIKNATFKSNTTGTVEGFDVLSLNAYFYNCKFYYTGNKVSAFKIEDNKCTFDDCRIEAPLVALTSTNAEIYIINKTKIEAQRCYLMANVIPKINKLVIDNAVLNSTNLGGNNDDSGILIAYNCDQVKITNSTIISGSNANTIGFLTVNRAATTTYILQNNIYYCGSAYDIFVGTFDAADLGSCEVLGGTFNKAPAALATVNISTTSLTVTGLQEVI